MKVFLTFFFFCFSSYYIAQTTEQTVIEKQDSISNKNSKNEGKVQALMVCEEMPRFPGGLDAMIKFLKDNINYPEEARKNNIKGKVFLRFIIDQAGDVINVEVQKGVHPLLDAEAVRVVKMMPKWTPGKSDGKTVNVYYVLPINFNF